MEFLAAAVVVPSPWSGSNFWLPSCRIYYRPVCAGHHSRRLRLAEFGAVLLLFISGLELQPSRLWVMHILYSASVAPEEYLAKDMVIFLGYGKQRVWISLANELIIVRRPHT